MTRGVVRAAIALAAGHDGPRRVRAFDEDRFTLLATAFERLADDVAAAPQASLQLVGEARSVPVELVQGASGRTVVDDRSGDGSLAEGLRTARAASGPVALLGLCLNGPTRAGVPAPGEGAFALWVDEIPPGGNELLPTAFEPTAGRELSELIERGQSADALRRPFWQGLSPNPTERTDASPSSVRPPEVLARVSEGAYVPLPSYREGIGSRWRFEGERCGRCGQVTFPSRGRCRHCGADGHLTVARLPRQGLLVTAVTWIGAGGQPTEFDDQVAATGPYGVALVDLEAGARATVALTDVAVGSVRVGSRIDTQLRRLYALDGAWRYGRKGVPRSTAPAAAKPR